MNLQMPPSLESLLQREYAGNLLRDWLIAGCVFVGGTIVLAIVKKLLELRLGALAKRTSTDLDDLVVDLVRRTKLFFLAALAFFVAHHWLNLAGNAQLYVERGVKLATWIQVGLWLAGVLSFAIARMTHGKAAGDPARTMGASVLGFIARAFIWILVFLQCLQVLDQPVGALVASLGVGGIAVALALQNILGDLFASITILLDKPFVTGDVIHLGDFQGTVERIGIKTTRLRSTTGEEIVIGNNDLVSSRMRNFRRMRERRQVFTLGVTYETSNENIARIPKFVEEIIEKVPKTRFERAHLKAFGDFALLYEVVYIVLSPEADDAMDAQQAINFGIHDLFQREEIAFAYPTQTVIQASAPAPKLTK